MSSDVGLFVSCLKIMSDADRKLQETVVLSFSGEAKLTLVPVAAKNRSSQSGLLFLKSWRR